MSCLIKINRPSFGGPVFNEVEKWLRENNITHWKMGENCPKYFIITFMNISDAVHFKLGFEFSEFGKYYFGSSYCLDTSLVELISSEEPSHRRYSS